MAGDREGGVARTEIAPPRVVRALMQIVEEGELHARRGDVNADGEVDLSDAVGLLDHLYLESSALTAGRGRETDSEPVAANAVASSEYGP